MFRQCATFLFSFSFYGFYVIKFKTENQKLYILQNVRYPAEE